MFLFAGIEIPYFYHSHNCGLQNAGRRTERTVELAIANIWLESLERQNLKVTEIGAVSPYYWPGRIKTIIDPCDAHKCVSDHQSMFRYGFEGTNVLSISTIEHIGEGRYGQQEEKTPIDGLSKLIEEADRFLITFPIGCNVTLDEAVIRNRSLDVVCRVTYLLRQGDDSWKEVTNDQATTKYGNGQKPWANSIAVLERGVFSP